MLDVLMRVVRLRTPVDCINLLLEYTYDPPNILITLYETFYLFHVSFYMCTKNEMWNGCRQTGSVEPNLLFLFFLVYFETMLDCINRRSYYILSLCITKNINVVIDYLFFIYSDSHFTVTCFNIGVARVRAV